MRLINFAWALFCAMDASINEQFEAFVDLDEQTDEEISLWMLRSKLDGAWRDMEDINDARWLSRISTTYLEA